MENLEQALRQIRALIPKENIRDDEASRYKASMDNLRLSQMPSIVFKPTDEEEISKILKISNEFKIPLTTRGAGSATTGSASPVVDGWVLDLSSWKHIHIDKTKKMAYVQPGATIEEIDSAAEEVGLLYPPDPGSKKYATIGGTIATNAGGLRGAKYGVTRDYIYALEGFLPTGEFVRWGADLRKFSAGFNLRDLWIGSEGMLGIITGAVLKLIPRPIFTETAILAFSSEKIAIEAIHRILELRIIPSVLEFLDSQTIHCTNNFWEKISPENLKALPPKIRKLLNTDSESSIILLEVDGRSKAETMHQLKEIINTVEGLASFTQKATSSTQAETFWTLRRSCSQAMFQLGNTKLNEDIVIPASRYLDLIRLTQDINQKTGLATPTFGHAADGNFHVHIMYDQNSETQKTEAAKAIEILMKTIVSWGGVISGEHGIGLAKSKFLKLQHGSAEIEAMKKIKSALDPNNILNSNKIFTPISPWDFTREEVRLPWDH